LLFRKDFMSDILSLAERFWPKVDKSGECWLWTASVDQHGYGQMWSFWHQRPVRASRIAWYLETGKWPDLLVCHHCDNPTCVRFLHLFQGNHKANSCDAAAKGRIGLFAKTECNPAAAFQRTKTQCAVGHHYDVQNTIWYHDGKWRRCRACMNAIRRERRRRRNG